MMLALCLVVLCALCPGAMGWGFKKPQALQKEEDFSPPDWAFVKKWDVERSMAYSKDKPLEGKGHLSLDTDYSGTFSTGEMGRWRLEKTGRASLWILEIPKGSGIVSYEMMVTRGKHHKTSITFGKGKIFFVDPKDPKKNKRPIGNFGIGIEPLKPLIDTSFKV